MLTFNQATVDYDPPLSRGGSWEQAVLACAECNSRRGNMKKTLRALTPEETARLERLPNWLYRGMVTCIFCRQTSEEELQVTEFGEGQAVWAHASCAEGFLAGGESPRRQPIDALSAAKMFVQTRGLGDEDARALAELIQELATAGLPGQRDTRWGHLVREFQSLSKLTGTDKATSYEVKVWIDLHGGWQVELGTYDILDWPRHTRVGDFDTEGEALDAFERLIAEARKAIEEGKK